VLQSVELEGVALFDRQVLKYASPFAAALATT
jgi:hypothetical protein